MARLVGILLVLACVAAIASASDTYAQTGEPVLATPISVLDGQRFAGEFTPIDKPSGRRDEFIFANGKFHSRECLDFGFAPAPYWVRLENGRVHFWSRLTSEENGEMIYEGVVADTELDAQIKWLRPRWYWTMKRDFRFVGHNDANVATGRK